MTRHLCKHTKTIQNKKLLSYFILIILTEAGFLLLLIIGCVFRNFSYIILIEKKSVLTILRMKKS